MTDISFTDFNRWLFKYGEAWEKGDSRAVIDLFTDDAKYYENPFSDPIVGKNAIQKYWSAGAGQSQRDVHFKHEIIAIVKNIGLTHWQASFIRVPSGNKVELDGFLKAEFDENGKCFSFREWWHRREEGIIVAS